ncbi:hexosyltransferase [Halovivax asiaticus JCM 14624]|uniref:Hexosyltransferase n=1 Tax=Halovivax asiaticus JCM 14624 TaxID=1227490 RepID=M0BSB0_9EURY|nr:glycosyltransferase family 4 protein [Halovivax asiaticus]ELZ13896.1 hexosyltransferase [Halovivax asiaticus JCM 14624]
MRVGYFCYHLSGTGPATRARDVINAIAAETPVDVVVLTGEPEKVESAATVVPVDARDPLDAARKVRRHFADADLVHVPINVYQAAFVRLGYRGPLVGGVGPGIQSTLRHGLLGRAIGIDLKIKTHESMRRWDRYGYETAVCTATIDRDDFHPYDDDRVRTVRQQLGLDPETNVLLYVGALSEPQGAHLVSELARQYGSDADTETTVVVAGDGPLRSTFEERDDLRYEGFVANDALPDYYNAADMTVIPRAEDVTSNVGLESIACGTPVVTTADGIVRDIFQARGTYVWADRNVAAVRETVDALLADDDRYRAQVTRGLETFDDMALSLDDAVETHRRIYERLARGDSAKARFNSPATP